MSVDLIFNIENSAFLILPANNQYTVQGLKYSNRTRVNFTSKNELIYIRDFEAVKKTSSRVLSGLQTLGFASSF